MRPVVFIYARSDSQRLPGKALMPLAGMPLVALVAARAARVGAQACILVTTDRALDDKLAETGRALGLDVVRGHATDLVARSLQAIAETNATHFLRVNGDSPFFAPELAAAAMEHLRHADLVSNLIRRSFPYGVAVEWVSAVAYADLADSAADAEREHVTQHLYRQVSRLNALSVEQSRDDSHLRLALDTAQEHADLTRLIGTQDPTRLSYWTACGLAKPKLVVTSPAKGAGAP